MNDSPDPQTLLPTLPAPMTVGQILDRVYRLIRSNMRLFFGIATVPSTAIFAVVGAALSFMIPLIRSQMAAQPVTPPNLPPNFTWVILIPYPIFIAIYVLYMPAATFAATQADLGVVAGVKQAYSVAWSRFGRYLWLFILCALLLVVPITVVAAMLPVGILGLQHATGAGVGPAGAFFLFPLLALLFLGIFIYCVLVMLRLAVAYPASVEEGLTAWAAIRRSAALTRNAKGRMFLVMLVVYAVSYAVNLVCIAVLVALAALVAIAAMAAHVTVGSPAFLILVALGIFGYLLVIMVATILSYTGITTAVAVIYHDQRLRIDGSASTPSHT